MAAPGEPRGLTGAEAAVRLAAEGPNELIRPGARGILHPVADVLKEPMLLLLLAAGTIYLLLGDREEALALLFSACVVITITLVQERKTERALAALRDLASPQALVVRDGERIRVPGRAVVRGDLLVLGEGDRVAADARLVASAHLEADGGLVAVRDRDEARTASARYAASDGVVRGDRPIEISGPGYRLAGPAFTLDPRAATLAVRGGVRLVAGAADGGRGGVRP
jgi:Ca2+-transporting ATPase